jgi:hypothetical protein
MEQLGGDLAVMGLTGGPAEPDRSPAPVYEHVDFGPECARQATDTMIPTRPFPSKPASALGRKRCRSSDASVVHGGDGVHHPVH